MLLCVGLLTACASKPVVYQDLAVAPKLTPAVTGNNHIVYRYDRLGVNWRAYNSAMLEPVVIYRGADNQFGNMSGAAKAELAAYTQSQFAKALAAQYALVRRPGRGTLRVRVTLTGARNSIPVLAPATKLLPAGAAINVLRTIRDKPAKYTGSVTFAVAIYDSATSRLLRAYISKQYPRAEDIVASIGPLSAAEAGIRRGAGALVKKELR